MKTLLKHLKAGGIILITLVTFSFSVSAASHHQLFKTPLKSGCVDHYQLIAVMPEAVSMPTLEIISFRYPANDAKPINLHYQPIRFNSLGLIEAQANI